MNEHYKLAILSNKDLEDIRQTVKNRRDPVSQGIFRMVNSEIRHRLKTPVLPEVVISKLKN